jgi:hypothetical protein
VWSGFLQCHPHKHPHLKGKISWQVERQVYILRHFCYWHGIFRTNSKNPSIFKPTFPLIETFSLLDVSQNSQIQKQSSLSTRPFTLVWHFNNFELVSCLLKSAVYHRGWITAKAYYVILGNQIPIFFLLHGKHWFWRGFWGDGIFCCA